RAARFRARRAALGSGRLCPWPATCKPGKERARQRSSARRREIRALRRIRRETGESRYIFITERDAPMTTAGFRKMLTRKGEASGLTFPVHPHMLRHAAGYKLANQGVDTRSLQHYLGHKNIQHTVRYSELAADRFKDFWRD